MITCVYMISLILQYREYKVRAGDDRDKIIKFRFCDTMGLEGEGGLQISDVEKIMDGQVRDQTEVRTSNIADFR